MTSLVCSFTYRTDGDYMTKKRISVTVVFTVEVDRDVNEQDVCTDIFDYSTIVFSVSPSDHIEAEIVSHETVSVCVTAEPDKSV